MKLFRAIIFILTVVLSTFVGKTVKAATYFSFQQTTQKTDTTKKGKNNDIDIKKIQYAASDSTVTEKKTGIVYLHGNAKVMSDGFELNADYIRYDSKKGIVFARGITNKNGRYIGRPIFKMGQEGSGNADSLYYYTELQTATIYGIYTAQQGGFFSGGQAKSQPDNEAHIKGQIFSTCNIPNHPHYGIYITKGIITERQIITGPAYLKIEDIPMPLGIPFGFFPKPNRKSSGFILPTPNQDATKGFSLNGGGYYMAFNDHVDGRLITNVFTNGSYDLTFSSNYIKRYKYNGGVNLSYSSLRNGLEGTPAYKPRTAFNISWTHTQAANARPGTNFSASVNAGTSNYYKETAALGSYDIDAIAQNTLNSSISYSKIFGDGLFNFAGAFTGSQETLNKGIFVELPRISLSMLTINPFDSKKRVAEQKWYQKITVGYNMEASNSIRTTEDLLFDKGGLKRFSNGVRHSIPINMAFNVLDYFNFNASLPYTERWYFQTIRQRRFQEDNSIAIDTVSGFRRAAEYSIGMGMSTKIYGNKQFKNLGSLKAIRHVITPTFNFSYKPDFSAEKYGYYKKSYYYVNDIRPGYSTTPIDPRPIKDANGRDLKYSIFEGSQFGGPSIGEQANIGFSVDNNVELKVKSKTDTTGGGEKKIPIIQGLSFSGNYNFLAPEKKLSPIGFNGRSQFTEKLGVNFSGSLSPYVVGMIDNPSYGDGPVTQSLGETNRYVFADGKLPRLTNFNFSFDFSLNPEAFKKRNENLDKLNNQVNNNGRTPEQLQQLEALSRDPNAFVDFTIPWNLTFSYAFGYSNLLSTKETRQVNNTLNFSGDFSLTQKWKVQFTSGWDFQAKNISYTRFTIYRDLHCWDFNASWTPFGMYQSYSITIKVKEAILQDLKLSKRKDFYTRY
ncbi:MAG: putative LPS assembly protein LptD [Bacteroidota bacterium]